MDPLTRLMDDGDERLTMKNRLRRIAAVAPPSIISRLWGDQPFILCIRRIV